MKPIFLFSAMLLVLSCCVVAAQQSPASQRPPKTVTPQTYPKEVIQAGQTRFLSECGFCHGRDAAGGETGPDLTRSPLVAEDSRGDKIGPVVRTGRADKGMPPFNLSETDLGAIVAFIHDQKTKAEAVGGGRRGVDVADLQTGDAEAGQRYFNGAGGCAKCHSPARDLAGVATRFQGLALLQRMLWPPGTRPATAPAKVTVTLPSGETITGALTARDEFSISMRDPSGTIRNWPINEIKFTVDDPVQAHFEQLDKYSDTDMHNVYAYIQTLQ